MSNNEWKLQDAYKYDVCEFCDTKIEFGHPMYVNEYGIIMCEECAQECEFVNKNNESN